MLVTVPETFYFLILCAQFCAPFALIINKYSQWIHKAFTLHSPFVQRSLVVQSDNIMFRLITIHKCSLFVIFTLLPTKHNVRISFVAHQLRSCMFQTYDSFYFFWKFNFWVNDVPNIKKIDYIVIFSLRSNFVCLSKSSPTSYMGLNRK